MTDTRDPDTATRCIACREAIRPDASICPQCGTNQHPSSWKTISEVLKWTGGIVTVISLVVGTITLGGYYQDWREKNAAVSELIRPSSCITVPQSLGAADSGYSLPALAKATRSSCFQSVAII